MGGVRNEGSTTRRAMTTNNGTTPDVRAAFDAFWTVYPKRAGNRGSKTATCAKFCELAKRGVDPQQILEAARRYKRYCDHEGQTGTRYTMRALSWLGPQTEGWTQEWDLPSEGRARNPYEAAGEPQRLRYREVLDPETGRMRLVLE